MPPTQLLCACANGPLQQVFQQCMAGELWQQATVGSAASLHSLAWKRPAAGWVASCCAGALLLSRPLTAAVTAWPPAPICVQADFNKALASMEAQLAPALDVSCGPGCTPHSSSAALLPRSCRPACLPCRASNPLHQNLVTTCRPTADPPKRIRCSGQPLRWPARSVRSNLRG